MDSDEVSTDVQRIVEIHKRNVSSEDPKLERIKFRMHRSTSIDSSSSSAYDVANRKRKYHSSNRNLGARQRKKRRVSLSRIARAQENWKQLNEHCLHFLDEPINLIDVITINNEYQTLSPQHRKKFMLDSCNSRVSGQNKFAITFRSKTFSVCNACFACFHGVTVRTVQRTMKDKSVGIVRYNVDRDDAPTQNHSMLNLEASSWITHTYTHYGDFMPDESTVCLPVYTKTELHNWYASSNSGIPHYSKPEFMRHLRKEFPFITFRQFKKFMQCEFCHDIDTLVKKEKVHVCLTIYLECYNMLWFVLHMN